MPILVHHYYSVTRANEEHTTVAPGDHFNFEIKVLFHAADSFPQALQHHFCPASISAQDFFQDGPNFLRSVLSLSPFTVGCLEEVAEGILSNVQGLFRVESVPDFVSLEPQESQHRIIPLMVTVIILNYGERPEVSRQRSRRSERLSVRRSERLGARRSERLSSRASQRQSSRVNQRESSEVNYCAEVKYGSEDEAIINTYLKKCTVITGREDCCICLEELKINVNAGCYSMPCEHAFHLPCILTWLKLSHVCPLCRHTLPPPEPTPSTDSLPEPTPTDSLPQPTDSLPTGEN